jgi:hypothetical protein
VPCRCIGGQSTASQWVVPGVGAVQLGNFSRFGAAAFDARVLGACLEGGACKGRRQGCIGRPGEQGSACSMTDRQAMLRVMARAHAATCRKHTDSQAMISVGMYWCSSTDVVLYASPMGKSAHAPVLLQSIRHTRQVGTAVAGYWQTTRGRET